MPAAPEHQPLLLEGIASTRAIRRYTDDPVPPADLANLLEFLV